MNVFRQDQDASMTPVAADDTKSSLARRSGLSLWRQVVETLEGEIRLGVHVPDRPLPNERDLAARFSVARQTVRRAMAALEQKGVVSIEQGRGTFLRRGVTYSIGPRTRFSANLLQGGHEPSRRLVRSIELGADALVAARLDLNEGDVVALILFSRHFFPAARLHGIRAAFDQTLSITAALDRVGVRGYTRLATQVTARLPTAEEAHYLEQPGTLPILVAESVNIDAGRRPVDYGIAHFASDKVVLDIPAQ
jgi:GntR family phosphonate transport system transcriptional regulator